MSTDSEYLEIPDAVLALEVLVAEFDTYILLSEINFAEIDASCHSIEPY